MPWLPPTKAIRRWIASSCFGSQAERGAEERLGLVVGVNSLTEFSGRSVLVTGGSGFIGSHLCDVLAAQGALVHSASRRALVPGNLQHHLLDVTDTAAVQQVFADIRPEFVFHLAGDSRGARDMAMVLPTFHSNLAATVNILLAATEHKARRIVLAGSLEEPTSAPPDVVPSSPYAASKLASSHYARMFHALYETPVTVARVFMVYGPRQHDLRKLVPFVTVSLLRGQAPRLSTGSRQVDWVYVEDVALGFMRAALRPDLNGETVDLGTGVLTTVAEVAQMLGGLVASDVQPEFGAIPERALEQIRAAECAQMQRLLENSPITNLADGLRRTVAWYRTEFAAGRLDLSGIYPPSTER